MAVPQSDGVIDRSQGVPAPSIIEGTTMEYYAGIDVSLESSSICVVDATGRIVCEAKVASEPEALTAWCKSVGLEIARIGLEAGPLSQWLFAGMKQAGLAIELLETRHVRNAFKLMPVKTDRKDARHRTVDPHGLVPSGALQIGSGAKNPVPAGRAQTAAEQAT